MIELAPISGELPLEPAKDFFHQIESGLNQVVAIRSTVKSMLSCLLRWARSKRGVLRDEFEG